MKAPYEDCPKFDDCSAPKCPLDPYQSVRSHRLEGEEKCTAQKRTRLRIAKNYDMDLLSYGGLTGQEHSGTLLNQR